MQYRLVRPPMAKWLIAGLRFVAPLETETVALQSAVEEARRLWGTSPKKPVPTPSLSARKSRQA